MTAAQRAPAEGALVGRYRLLNLLGSGPTSQVFRATNPNSEAPIALKLFDPTRCSTRGIRRYAELAAAAAAVPQSTATRLLEVQAAGPSPFAALELVPGQSLARMRQQEPILSWTVARALAARIAAGLTAVHQAGLVHAALKPTNIHIILGPSQRLHTRLLDFGAGALLEPEEVGVTRINDNPAVDYVSPEQLQGEQERPTTDLYSLGVILYELVTGRRPFEGRVTDIVRQHLRTPPAPPRTLVPGLPAEAEALILALLEKSPHQRPSMADVRACLAPPVRAAPMQAQPQPATPNHHDEPVTALWQRSHHDWPSTEETGPITLNSQTAAPGTVRTEVIRAAPPFQGRRDEVTLLPADMGGDFLRGTTVREETQVGRNSSATVFIDPVAHIVTPQAPRQRAQPAWRVWLAAPWSFEKKLLAMNFALVLVIVIGMITLAF